MDIRRYTPHRDVKKNLSTVSELIRARALKAFVLCACLQMLAIFFVTFYLAYQSAVNRAWFLVQSNEASLGLMISTGDLFQLKNVINSFKNENTPLALLCDQNNRNLLEFFDKEDHSIFSQNGPLVWYKGALAVVTKHQITYNNDMLGTLYLLNKVRPDEVLVICAAIMLFSIGTYFFQGKAIGKKTLEIGKETSGLAFFFEYTNSEDELKKFHRLRLPSGILEVETLASKIFEVLLKIIRAVDIEKEAAIGRISAHVTHDMRAPLGVFERILLTPNDEIPSMKEQIRDSLNRLNFMIESLRRGEVENLIRRHISSFDFAYGYSSLIGKANERNIVLTVPAEEIRFVAVDHLKVERAWINLVSNALEFAKTYVKVEAEVQGVDLTIRVSDDGPGVAFEFLPKLFERGATHGKADGTGLGLAYVRQVMRGHGGDVVYRREFDRTVFECYIPDAIEIAKEFSIDNSTIIDNRPILKLVRKVAICLKPEALSKAVLSRMTSFEPDKFVFAEERDGAHIVVSNKDEVMFEVLEGEGQEFIHVSPAWGDEEGIVSRLRLKFNLS